MKSVKQMSQAELAAYVQCRLESEGITVILSGGAAVAIYSSNQYVSQDIDLVNIYSVNRRAIRAAMQEIGFSEEGRHFKHPDSQFIVEFPPGPLTIGEERIEQVIEIKFTTGILRIISPTDCVKDRLAAYYHWGDNQCLAQAILVAQEHAIDLEEINRWSNTEGKNNEFQKIRSRLAGEL
jgi:hypothetical protein